MPTIGWLDTRRGVPSRNYVDGFRRGLAEIGFVEGRDVTVEYHTADGHLERLPSLADDLVRRRVAVIFAIRRFGTGRQDGDTDHPSCLWGGS